MLNDNPEQPMNPCDTSFANPVLIDRNTFDNYLSAVQSVEQTGIGSAGNTVSKLFDGSNVFTLSDSAETGAARTSATHSHELTSTPTGDQSSDQSSEVQRPAGDSRSQPEAPRAPSREEIASTIRRLGVL